MFSEKVKNKIEIRVCGLQRSGNHAIINWIRDQYKGAKICFLNNISHGNYNPFRHATGIYIYNFRDLPDGRTNGYVEVIETDSKDLLLYSYEDCRYRLKKDVGILESFYCGEFEENRLKYIGKSEFYFDILIVRDPYNLLASRLKKGHQLTSMQEIDSMLENIKAVLKEAVRIQSMKNPSRILIKYNQWFTDRNYRQEVSNLIQGSFSDSTLKEVASFGGGSSFDGMSFNQTFQYKDILNNWRKFFKISTYQNLPSYWEKLQGATKMDVLERWKSIDEPELKILMKDQEITYLSKELFGEIINPIKN